MSIIRQGDVALVRVKAIPADAVEQAAPQDRLVLQYGEVTHHAHAFYDDSHNVKLYVAHGGARYLHVTAPADLKHEEHSTARVGVGKYLLPTQMEYTPKELVRVTD
jgi:hypothetical protein